MEESTLYNEEDKKFMALALNEAEQAFDAGDYPVGAVLTINGDFIGKAKNSILTETQTTSHAEHKLLSANSAQLRRLIRESTKYDICLYTTLEPCLMCLGVSILHRVTRIVVASPDPHGGAINIDPNDLGVFYGKHWPKIEIGLMKENSADLVMEFIKTEKFLSWEIMLEEFSRMMEKW